MGIKINNNAFGTLSGSIDDVVTSIPLTAGHGARFPTLAAGDYFYATLVDASGNLEIIKVTARSTDTLTAVRGQDGTTGTAYASGDRLELRPCNATMESLRQESSQFVAASGTNTYTATLSPVPTGYNSDQVYRIKFANANTAVAPTLNLNSLGAKTIKKMGGASLGPGNIIADHFALLSYDGTDMILLNPYEGIQPGTMLDFGGASAPSGYLPCDGSAVSRTVYAALFAAISTTWGAGDGATTFNVPNFQRRVAVGSGGSGTSTLGNAVGNAGGAETHTLTLAESPAHTHSVSGTAVSSVDPIGNQTVGGAFDRAIGGLPGSEGANQITWTVSGTAASQGGGGAHNNMQPSAVVLKIIKI